MYTGYAFRKADVLLFTERFPDLSSGTFRQRGIGLVGMSRYEMPENAAFASGVQGCRMVSVKGLSLGQQFRALYRHIGCKLGKFADDVTVTGLLILFVR